MKKIVLRLLERLVDRLFPRILVIPPSDKSGAKILHVSVGSKPTPTNTLGKQPDKIYDLLHENTTQR